MSDADGPLAPRQAVRAILLTPADELLMIRVREARRGVELWLMPGGGIQVGEPPEACLRRELREETGLAECDVGPQVWTRQHTFQWNGRLVRQRERYYLVRVARFEATMEHNPEADEKASCHGFRWWRPEEITASSERFVPLQLGRWLGRLIKHGPPGEPIDVGP